MQRSHRQGLSPSRRGVYCLPQFLKEKLKGIFNAHLRDAAALTTLASAGAQCPVPKPRAFSSAHLRGVHFGGLLRSDVAALTVIWQALLRPINCHWQFRGAPPALLPPMFALMTLIRRPESFS
jgi:hypothetical protein